MIERRRFLKKRKSITKLQAIARGRRVRRLVSSQMVEPMESLDENGERSGPMHHEFARKVPSQVEEISKLTKAVQAISMQMQTMQQELRDMKRLHAEALQEATNTILASPSRHYLFERGNMGGEMEIQLEQGVRDGWHQDAEHEEEEEGEEEEEEEAAEEEEEEEEEEEDYEDGDEYEEGERQRLSLSMANRIRKRMQQRMQEQPQQAVEDHQGWKRGHRDRQRLYGSEQEKRIVEQTILAARARRLAREAEDQQQECGRKDQEDIQIQRTYIPRSARDWDRQSPRRAQTRLERAVARAKQRGNEAPAFFGGSRERNGHAGLMRNLGGRKLGKLNGTRDMNALLGMGGSGGDRLDSTHFSKPPGKGPPRLEAFAADLRLGAREDKAQDKGFSSMHSAGIALCIGLAMFGAVRLLLSFVRPGIDSVEEL